MPMSQVIPTFLNIFIFVYIIGIFASRSEAQNEGCTCPRDTHILDYCGCSEIQKGTSHT